MHLRSRNARCRQYSRLLAADSSSDANLLRSRNWRSSGQPLKMHNERITPSLDHLVSLVRDIPWLGGFENLHHKERRLATFDGAGITAIEELSDSPMLSFCYEKREQDRYGIAQHNFIPLTSMQFSEEAGIGLCELGLAPEEALNGFGALSRWNACVLALPQASAITTDRLYHHYGEPVLLATWFGPLWRFNLAHPLGR
jgi:hypothetical protein